MRTHQYVFEVEPTYTLRLFEEFVVALEAECILEASCKIERDRLNASRFMLFSSADDTQPQAALARSLEFFSQVERQVGVSLDDALLSQFLDDDFDFNKVTILSTGIDLRTNLADCSLKIHIRMEDYTEKIQQHLALADDSDLLASLSQFIAVVGFDFFFDGRSAIEFYPEVKEQDFHKPETDALVWRNYPSFVRNPLEASSMFGFGVSKANASPVLYYTVKERQLLPIYFRLNDTAQRVHSFYQQQNILPHMWVGTTLQELEKTRIENVRLYYYNSFDGL